MKKTILALLVASAATSAFAGEIYSTDTTNVSMKGEVDAYLATTDIQGVSTDADVNVWAKVQMDAEQKLSEQLTGFASFEIEAGSNYRNTDTAANFDDIHIGIKTDTWGLAVGEVGDLAESADAIQKDDITNEGNYMGSAGGNHRESKGNGIVAKTIVGPMTFVADINTTNEKNLDSTYGVSADYAHDVFSIGASFIQGETDSDEDYELYGVSASAEFKGVYLAATYAEFKGADSFGFYNTSSLADGETLGLAASYSLNNIRVYSTYAIADIESATESGDTTNWVIGADYAVASNITAFAEYQQADADWASEDSMTVVTGVYYSF
ncbi:porin [Vibrio sp. ZSDE26]|uniref:Porin n=1 Tax=Vibrio amylolyticus TaxID=2847292 RepID=A0A9X1XI63_9VIBR|nr:porin [Vibrio amylolyticus]MCK6263477.1 porin [Vibrio amylolyticus]